MDRKSLGKTEKFRYTVSPADTEKEKTIRKQVSFPIGEKAESCQENLWNEIQLKGQ